jgi:hypothetical protein
LHEHNTEPSIYAEDRWIPTAAFEPGIRFDRDAIVRHHTFSRLAGTYVLNASGNTKNLAGIGSTTALLST